MKSVEVDARLYFEFLSDPKLMNTAMTRARSLLAVVGDPVSLCTIGKCRILWRDYIKRCSDKGGLYGTNMEQLERDIIEHYGPPQLNPDAPAFVPSGNTEAGCEQEERTKVEPEGVAVEQSSDRSSHEILSDFERNNSRSGLATR